MWDKNHAQCSKFAAIAQRGDRTKCPGPGDPLGSKRIVGHMAEEFSNLVGHDLVSIAQLGIQVYHSLYVRCDTKLMAQHMMVRLACG